MRTTSRRKTSRPTLREVVANGVEHLFPGYFALVMATAAVSIGSLYLGHALFAHFLVWLNWLFYLCLWALTAVRLLFFRRSFISDLFEHQRAPGFFTIVAGTCVLGTQTIVVWNLHEIGLILWWIGLGLWVLVMYSFFTAVTVRERKPTLADGINGAWLIAAVATQSLVVCRGAVDGFAAPSAPIQFLCIAMFMIGCMLYLAIIPLIFYRLTFVELTAQDFTPPYWINMGAVAITTLAGSTLMLRVGSWPMLDLVAPFLPGFTLFFWAAASWWIPFLLALMVWRYIVRGDRIVYEPPLWGMVFPLGMYTTATYQLAKALNLPFLVAIPDVFIVVAIAAWTGTFVGLLAHLWRTLGQPFRA